jgi:hypothetical protein
LEKVQIQVGYKLSLLLQYTENGPTVYLLCADQAHRRIDAPILPNETVKIARAHNRSAVMTAAATMEAQTAQTPSDPSSL